MRWLWPGYLAQGKLHILAGAPGTGKTTIALALAASITRGGTFPDGTRAPAGDVLIWSGEDAMADTLVPRLLAADADGASTSSVPLGSGSAVCPLIHRRTSLSLSVQRQASRTRV